MEITGSKLRSLISIKGYNDSYLMPFIEFGTPLWVKDELTLEELSFELASSAGLNEKATDYKFYLQFELYGCDADQAWQSLKNSSYCPDGWTKGMYQCYQVVESNTTINFENAVSLCESVDGKLATPRGPYVSNTFDNTPLVEQIGSKQSWIGKNCSQLGRL